MKLLSGGRLHQIETIDASLDVKDPVGCLNSIDKILGRAPELDFGAFLILGGFRTINMLFGTTWLR
jgi:hypothetical protein